VIAFFLFLGASLLFAAFWFNDRTTLQPLKPPHQVRTIVHARHKEFERAIVLLHEARFQVASPLKSEIEKFLEAGK